jgi:hypothetical protein
MQPAPNGVRPRVPSALVVQFETGSAAELAILIDASEKEHS